MCLKGAEERGGDLVDTVQEDKKKALLYSKCTRVKADRWGVGGGVYGGVKSVQTQDLEAEQNDIARHTGHLEVKNAAAKLNE